MPGPDPVSDPIPNLDTEPDPNLTPNPPLTLPLTSTRTRARPEPGRPLTSSILRACYAVDQRSDCPRLQPLCVGRVWAGLGPTRPHVPSLVRTQQLLSACLCMSLYVRMAAALGHTRVSVNGWRWVKSSLGVSTSQNGSVSRVDGALGMTSSFEIQGRAGGFHDPFCCMGLPECCVPFTVCSCHRIVSFLFCSQLCAEPYHCLVLHIPVSVSCISHVLPSFHMQRLWLSLCLLMDANFWQHARFPISEVTF